MGVPRLVVANIYPLQASVGGVGVCVNGTAVTAVGGSCAHGGRQHLPTPGKCGTVCECCRVKIVFGVGG